MTTQLGPAITDSYYTSHLAHFLLTTNLLATLRRTADKKGSDVRVVNVPSPPPSLP